MNEYERVKKEALLTPYEIRTANTRVLKRHGIELPQTLHGYLSIPEEERLQIIEEQEHERLQTQVDKVLKADGIVIKADDQSLPEVPYNYEDECQQYTSYSKAQQDMRRAGFVKVEQKESK